MGTLVRVATNVDFSTKRGKTKIFITNVEKRGFRWFLWKNRGNLKLKSSKKHANFPFFRNKTVAFGNNLLKKKKSFWFSGNFSLDLATWMKSTFWAEKCRWRFFFGGNPDTSPPDVSSLYPNDILWISIRYSVPTRLFLNVLLPRRSYFWTSLT